MRPSSFFVALLVAGCGDHSSLLARPSSAERLEDGTVRVNVAVQCEETGRGCADEWCVDVLWLPGKCPNGDGQAPLTSSSAATIAKASACVHDGFDDDGLAHATVTSPVAIPPGDDCLRIEPTRGADYVFPWHQASP